MSSTSARFARVLLVACVLAGASARADEFREHYERALSTFRAGDYPGSERELRAAYALRPLPALLLNLGHAVQEQGRYAEALDLYDRYLRDEPGLTAAQRLDVDQYRQQARLALIRQSQPNLLARPLVRAGIGVGAAGVALLITGAITGGLAVSAAKDVVAGSGPFDQALDDRGRALGGVATACFVLGGLGLVAGGVLEYIGVDRARRENPPLKMNVGPGSLGFSGAF